METETKGRNIFPPSNAIELAAAVEVARTLAFFALTTALGAAGGDIKANADNLKNAMLALFQNAKVELPPADAQKYQGYAEGCIEELFSRLAVNSQQVNPKSS